MKTTVPYIFLLAICQYVSSQYVSSDINRNKLIQRVEADPHLEAYLREAIENFREQMKQGIDAISMPVLDPLQLKRLDISVLENLATMDLKIKTITVEGLSNFQFHDIYPDLESYFLKVNLTIPHVESWGTYDLNGKLLKIFPLKGNGNFEINITEAEISGVGQLKFVNKTLEMTKLELDLRWKSMNVFLENFLGGGKFAEILQKLIPKTGKSVFDNFKPDILKFMNTALTKAVNKELERPEVKNIIQGILQSS